MWASQTGPKVILSLGVILKVRIAIIPLFRRFLDSGFDQKSSADAAVSRSRAILPSSQQPPDSSGAALPARKGVKSFFLVAPWGLCVFVPRRHRPQPQRRTPKAMPTAGADGLKQIPPSISWQTYRRHVFSILDLFPIEYRLNQ